MLLILWSYPAGGQAHTTKISHSEIRLTGQTLTYALDVSPHDLAVLLGLAGPQAPLMPLKAFISAHKHIGAILQTGILVENNGVRCQAGQVELNGAHYPQTLRLKTHYQCAAPLDYITLTFQLFFNLDPRHKNIGKIHYLNQTEAFLFAVDMQEFALDLTARVPRSIVSRIWRFLSLGIEHIATGYDHILFLFCLMLASGRWRQLVKIVTAFTVAHSLTLVLATLGGFTPPLRLVEAVIALSIAYVALENMLTPYAGTRWRVAFIFGLVHGFGFYGILHDLQLPQQGLVLTLFSFNLGVEAGQIAIVALCYPALRLLAKQKWHPQMVYSLSFVIFCLGIYWFVERAFMS